MAIRFFYRWPGVQRVAKNLNAEMKTINLVEKVRAAII
jgi:hypothetical protein